MTKKLEIEGTSEAWESGTLGQDDKFVKIADDIKQAAVDDSLELQMISIRLQKSLIDDMKMIAKLNGCGYQPLIRQILTRFVDCEKKQLLKQYVQDLNKAEEIEQNTPGKSEEAA